MRRFMSRKRRCSEGVRGKNVSYASRISHSAQLGLQILRERQSVPREIFRLFVIDPKLAAVEARGIDGRD